MNANLKDLFESSGDVDTYVRGVVGLMTKMISDLDVDGVVRLVEAVEATGDLGRAIFAFGNGGSAAVASHFVVDMGVGSLVDEGNAYRVVCLSDNEPSLTAIANDFGFEEIFVRRLKCDMRPGDLCIALSVSGNSANVVRALQYAVANGGRTFAITGTDGSRIAEVAHDCIHIASSLDEYGLVEDAFSVVLHVVSTWLSMKQGRFLDRRRSS